MAHSQHLVGQHSQYADTGLLETHGQTGELTIIITSAKGITRAFIWSVAYLG